TKDINSFSHSSCNFRCMALAYQQLIQRHVKVNKWRRFGQRWRFFRTVADSGFKASPLVTRFTDALPLGTFP
ncbi:MAG: hypothetical protein WCK86_07895, partial [Planctomycetia bacterium]